MLLSSPSAAGSSRPLEDRTVTLRPVLARDTDLLYLWATDPLTADTWRYRGTTPSPEAFQRSLWENVIAQYLVISRASAQPLGLVGLYNANLASGYAYAYALAAGTSLGSGAAVRGLVLLGDLAFRRWPLRRIYLETTSRSLPQFQRSTHRLVREVARLAGHEVVGDELVDLVTLQLDREDFGRFVAERLERRELHARV